MNITVRDIIALSRILLVPFLLVSLALGASLYQWHKAEIQIVRYQSVVAHVGRLETEVAILTAKTDAYKQLLEDEMKVTRLLEIQVAKLADVMEKLVESRLDTESRWGPM